MLHGGTTGWRWGPPETGVSFLWQDGECVHLYLANLSFQLRCANY